MCRCVGLPTCCLCNVCKCVGADPWQCLLIMCASMSVCLSVVCAMSVNYVCKHVCLPVSHLCNVCKVCRCASLPVSHLCNVCKVCRCAGLPACCLHNVCKVCRCVGLPTCCLCRSMAMLLGAWPPMDRMTPSGFSRL